MIHTNRNMRKILLQYLDRQQRAWLEERYGYRGVKSLICTGVPRFVTLTIHWTSGDISEISFYGDTRKVTEKWKSNNSNIKDALAITEEPSPL